jgi:hypothetical protein
MHFSFNYWGDCEGKKRYSDYEKRIEWRDISISSRMTTWKLFWKVMFLFFIGALKRLKP